METEHFDDALSDLRQFVVERRKLMGWRQQTVADRAGVSQSWVASLESSRLKGLPQDETLNKLAKGLALPSEPPGMLYGFLKRMLSGYFNSDEISDLASGKITPAAAIEANAANRAHFLAVPPDEPPDEDTPLTLDLWRQRREGKELVLKVLKRDLPPDDFTVLRRMVELLYSAANEAEGYPSDAAIEWLLKHGDKNAPEQQGD